MAKLNSYALSVALTKLEHGFITTKTGTRCLVIPIDKNYLTEKDGAVYMQTDVVVMEQDDKENHGFQVQKLPTEIYKKLGADVAKEIKLPYLGNLKIFAKKTNDAVEATVIEQQEDADELGF